MGIFDNNLNIRPYKYPHLIEFAHAIHHSFWIPDHFTYDRDVHDYKVNLSESEREAIKRSMLAIGVVENKVKTFWGRLDMRMPLTEIAIVGQTFGGNECHIEGTELLTPSGWVDFKNVKDGDIVYQYNIDDSSITSTKISNIVNKPFSGDMVRYNSKMMDAIVTPNHRMIYKTESGEVKESPAKDFNFHSNRLFPKSGVLSNSGEDKLSNLDRIRIAIQADGTRVKYTSRGGEERFRGVNGGYSYHASFKKEKKIIRFRELLDIEGLDYKEFNPNGREDYTTFKIRIDSQFDLKTFEWVNLSDKSNLWCKEFVQELLLWDGYISDKKSLYISTNKSCVDIAQVIGILAGYRTHISKSEDNRKESYKARYTLSFKEKPMLESCTQKGVSFPYTGNVYCGTVGTGLLLTRYNDRVFISGNCIHQLTYEKLLVLLGLEKEFESIFEVPCMKGRSEYLTKYLSGVSSVSNKEFAKSLILFTLLVENASLFSQFLVVSSFNKYKNILTNFSSVVGATAREENIHAKFGEALINIIRKENPEWFDSDMEDKIRRNIRKAFESECKVLDWIFEKGELEFLPKINIQEYLKSRLNKSLNQIGYSDEFIVNEELLVPCEFLEVQLTASTSFDFFNEKSSEYSQNSSFDEDNMW